MHEPSSLCPNINTGFHRLAYEPGTYCATECSSHDQHYNRFIILDSFARFADLLNFRVNHSFCWVEISLSSREKEICVRFSKCPHTQTQNEWQRRKGTSTNGAYQMLIIVSIHGEYFECCLQLNKSIQFTAQSIKIRAKKIMQSELVRWENVEMHISQWDIWRKMLQRRIT